MYRYEFTKGDTGKPLELEIFDGDGVVDITGASIVFSYEIAGQKYEKTGFTITDGPNGLASVYWTSGDFIPWTADNFQCQIKVTLSSGKIRYFPDDGQFGVLSIRLPL